ncbi:segregation and condensation protein A [Psychrobacter pygoscelis]|uniref:segregation and condensation protein A n=1 Tax=Psychrobacter pygoscelis TaxID=2488563 RepID=UPI00103AB0BF|nr:segregation/condensation protein A [Psychrobacter pygoscelis]
MTTLANTAVRLYQTPIESLPEDLYIPPQAFAIWLEQFEGPLDFLLYLVKKNNFDLTDTAILPITEQYLAYISELDEAHFELAGDYLLMASTLIAIKTELLLPRPEEVDGKRDERDPKAELIARLEDYAQIKEASRRLDQLVRLERDVFLAMASLPNPEIMAAELPSYPATMLTDSLLKMQLKPDYQMHTVKADSIPLEDRIASISRQLASQGQGSFADLLDKSQGKLGIVVSFVAVLELIKRQLITVVYPAPVSDGNLSKVNDIQSNMLDSTLNINDAKNDAANEATSTNLSMSELTLQWVS